MIVHNKNFYSLEELKRTIDCYEDYQDGEEVYYFVGALRYACDEIERLNNIINELENYLNEQVDYMTHHSIERMVAFDCCRHKLQELKGSDN